MDLQTAKYVRKFIYKNIMTRSGCPVQLVSNQGKHFMNEVIRKLTIKHMTIHKKSLAYHWWLVSVEATRCVN